LSILSICAALILIIKSQSRQGLVVILFAVLFYITLFAFYKNKKLRFPIAAVSIIIVASSILGMLQIGPLKSVLYKDSVSVRGYYWRAAWKMFQENPLLGVGLDRYGAYFKEYREPEYALINGFNLTSTNAHNTFLQLLSTGGFMVGMFYIALLSLIFITGLKNIAKSQLDEQKINLLLLSAWIGFQAQSFISIDNIGISVWGWLLGAT
jgi:O-antigen ligase